ncbi:sarcosine oxidase subunit gamma [Roseibium sp. MMSF_3544]|uniref:sarcosine oxidase subunit gamma n=1 Tax=unclassified Roseibium TaxID=2629323 RepID=UPI00274013C6|nr:sarcosine oxidase subunit gamma [Roseibium sp. MMSF_3544]
MAETLSALKGHWPRTNVDRDGTRGVTLAEVASFHLTQIAAWPDSLARVGGDIAKAAGCDSAPGPGRAHEGTNGTLLRIEPLKWWLVEAAGTSGRTSVSGADRAVLDLSAARTWIRLSGPKASVLLNHFLPLNLSEQAFPEGSVASSSFHHIGVTLWRDEPGYNLFLPRSFAVSLWELLVESAVQYGYEVA